MGNFKLDDVVEVPGKHATGRIAFIGKTHFSDGTWIGVILDEPKGRNNGIVDGTRYFICPRNHGVFVRDCQIEKVFNSLPTKVKYSMPRKITYPHYLKAGSKLKSKTNLTISRNGDNIRNNKLKYAKDRIEEECHIAFAAKKDEELCKIKKQNEELQLKQKNIEALLKDTLKKYTQTVEENKHLCKEIVKMKKQLLMRNKPMTPEQTTQYDDNKLKLLKNSRIKSNSMRNNESPLKTSDIKSNKCQNFLEKQLDSESLKAASSMQRLAELEEQNMIMIQGLVELREFLKSHCEVQCTECLEIANDTCKRQPASSRRKFTRSARATNRSLPRKPMRIESLKSISKLQEFHKMLSEMTTFSKIIKNKDKPEMVEVGSEASSNIVYENSNLSPKENYRKDKNIYKMNQKVFDPRSSRGFTPNLSALTKFSKESETLHKSSICNNSDTQTYKTDNDQLTGCSNNMTAEVNQTAQVDYLNCDSSLKASEDSLKQPKHKYSLKPAAEDTIQSTSISCLRQDAFVEDLGSSKAKLFWAKSCSMPELTLIKSDAPFLSPIRSIGDGAATRPNGKRSKRRMFYF